MGHDRRMGGRDAPDNPGYHGFGGVSGRRTWSPIRASRWFPAAPTTHGFARAVANGPCSTLDVSHGRRTPQQNVPASSRRTRCLTPSPIQTPASITAPSVRAVAHAGREWLLCFTRHFAVANLPRDSGHYSTSGRGEKEGRRCHSTGRHASAGRLPSCREATCARSHRRSSAPRNKRSRPTGWLPSHLERGA